MVSRLASANFAVKQVRNSHMSVLGNVQSAGLACFLARRFRPRGLVSIVQVTTIRDTACFPCALGPSRRATRGASRVASECMLLELRVLRVHATCIVGVASACYMSRGPLRCIASVAGACYRCCESVCYMMCG